MSAAVTLEDIAPDEWERFRLGDLFQENDVRVRSSGVSMDQIPILSITRDRGLVLQSEKFKRRVASSDISGYKLVRRGELVYGFPIDEGVIAILLGAEVGAVSPAYRVWKPKVHFDSAFVDRLLRMPSTLNIFRGLASTTVHRRRNLSKADFKNAEVLFPPLQEQYAIAAVLRTVQRAKEACEKVIAATRQLKQSLLKHLFTYGPVPFDQADKVPLKETEIGPMPEHWSHTKIGELAHLVQYGLSLRGKPSGKYPILRMNNLQDGKVVTDNIQGGLQYVDLSDAMLAKFRLVAGDLLFNRTNSFELVGKTSLFEMPGDYVFASYLVRLQLDTNRLDPSFANYYLCMPSAQTRLKHLASRGVSQTNINATKLKGFQIPVPPIDEQHQITAHVMTVDKKLAAEEARHTALANLFQSLLHHLMTGKVRLPEFVKGNA